MRNISKYRINPKEFCPGNSWGLRGFISERYTYELSPNVRNIIKIEIFEKLALNLSFNSSLHTEVSNDLRLLDHFIRKELKSPAINVWIDNYKGLK